MFLKNKMNDNINPIIEQPSFNRLLPLNWLANLFPLIGVIRYDWSFFLILYIFWFEMLIVTLFQDLRVLFSQKRDFEGRLFSSDWAFGVYKFWKVIRYTLFRIVVFLFYMLFIVVFVGLDKGNSENSLKDMASAMSFRNQFFNIAVGNFFLYGLIDFLTKFIINDKYKTSPPSDHTSFFDARMIVTHISIFLGAFLFPFVTEKIGFNSKAATIVVVAAFIILKIGIEYGANIVEKSIEKDVDAIRRTGSISSD
jgi:hypothetical protein